MMKTRSLSLIRRSGTGALLAAALFTAVVHAAPATGAVTATVADHGWGPAPSPNPDAGRPLA
ncbi:hypothetical protein ACIQRS_15155 [Streptomyces termitum]|nr:hypothetical protein [Streptomyces termitum]